MGSRSAMPAVLAACVCLLAACATSEAPHGAPTSTTAVSASSTSSSSSSGGLTVTLTATPSSTTPGTAVVFSLSAHENDALGAFGYQIAYGDGTTDQNAVPQWCRAAPGQPASQAWRLVHSYAKPGTYRVTARVAVNCTSDRTSATVTVTVSSA